MPKKKRKARGSSRKKKRKFQYKKRPDEEIIKRSKQKSGLYDPTYRDDLPVFSPKEGDSFLRLLPPTWEGAQHYGFNLWLHSRVGPDNQTFVCLRRMKNEACPVCEEIERARASGDDEYADEINAYRRVVMWVINREKEKDGPQIYAMPWTLDKDLAKRSVNKRTKEVLCIDDPEEGYDIEFTREGSARNTRYIGAEIARDPSPLSDDDDEFNDWLDFIVENPIPGCVEYYDYDHIANTFAGKRKKADEEEDDEEDDEHEGAFEKTRRPPEDEEEDEDEEIDAEDDDEELDDAEEFDDEEEDEGEDELPDDEDDDDEDGEDDDEDPEEDDEPPPKKSRKRSFKMGAKKKKGRQPKSRDTVSVRKRIKKRLKKK
jgi:hypothetical protein